MTSVSGSSDSGDQRDVVADLLRVGALFVVVVWHSTLSLFYRTPSGVLGMPNPIGSYRGLWMLTWVLQVMPLFFVVSGAVNASAWQRHHGRGGTAWSFSRRRLARFVVPIEVLLVVCGVFEVISRTVFSAPFMSRHLVILIPLWTLALLVSYAPVTPLLDRAWVRFGATTTVVLVAVVLLSDLVRFRASAHPAVVAEVISTVGVWLAAYQLGWVYRTAVRAGDAVTRSTGQILVIIGLVGLVISTNIDIYPRSMVSTTTDAMSNLLPTTAPILMLAMFQCGLVLLFCPRLIRWISSSGVQANLDKLGSYAVPAYLFHMIAVVAVVIAAEALGVSFKPTPSNWWWLTRPLWLAAVLVLLAPILWASRRFMNRF